MASVACARFCRSEPSAANTDCLPEIWQVNLDGPLHSVRYTHQCLIWPNEWRRIEGEFKLH
ncbi:protein usg [Rhizobium sp. ARZ01]|nr:protein usg [Rhizobium sp. ARZ01]